MNIAKSLFISIFIFLSVQLFGQERSTIAYFDASTSVLTSQSGNLVSNFSIKTDKVNIEIIKETAAKYPNTLKLELGQANKEMLYPAKLTFFDYSDIKYLHKMLLSFDIEKFNYNNKTYPLSEFINLVH